MQTIKSHDAVKVSSSVAPPHTFLCTFASGQPHVTSRAQQGGRRWEGRNQKAFRKEGDQKAIEGQKGRPKREAHQRVGSSSRNRKSTPCQTHWHNDMSCYWTRRTVVLWAGIGRITTQHVNFHGHVQHVLLVDIVGQCLVFGGRGTGGRARAYNTAYSSLFELLLFAVFPRKHMSTSAI